MDQQFGIIDLGSNSVRLVIYRKDETIQEIDNVKSVLRLSAHINKNGEIDKKGTETLIECLKRYSQFCRMRGVEKIYGIATAAVRSATNKDALIEEILEETGIPFRVLSGGEEAYFGYLAVVNTLPYCEAITVDIGGGSTEITYFKDRLLVYSHSFSFGAVTLFQIFGDDIDKIRNFVTEQLNTQDWIRGKQCPVIVMGGTARNLARIHQRKIGYSLSSLHNYVMNRGEVEWTLLQIDYMPMEQRKEINGLSKDRADILPAGITVFLAVMDQVQSKQLVSSNKGLRDGFLFDMLFKNDNGILPDILEYSTDQFMKRYRVDTKHALHVSQLAVQVFDTLKEVGCHAWGSRERSLLQAAAQLHDIGRSINIIEATKHTFYLIENVLLLGVTHKERIIIALSASFINSRQLATFASAHRSLLTKEDEKLASQLGAIVFLAKSLDRNMDQRIKGVQIFPTKKKLALRVIGQQVAWMKENIEESLKKMSKAYGINFTLKD
jgi:exopolyphosphatase/guanosine-5'-triphosphate,3'-diphosphate pyrophosphatase